ncbi:hypothetical protein TVAG_372210 [Trichomonas vaginalis G3]|uniref:Thioredoxin domain-containing protein n=1 Tax=Trichomonas vaginalis (strain ATCC PRA-98 / G3) TaxID=412133 RepID=A2FJW9_TRIV3|nr:thioredoxin-like family [Trichomonas vaginalis G3]EAX94795.1 hypothetical protein TVAG_372210 [Trichomonas vaginalis G3]KAI5531098.1 thioredoxin-like family [Trichomonas vaginalis G3]|eukprot:XP_001307725.1 hypothetical protein [Trichomonas vaginalis G3]
MFLLFSLWLTFADCRRKKKPESTSVDDEPNKYQPEFGKVWHPNPKRFWHYIGRERHALVAFVQKDDPGRQLAAVFEQIQEMIDPSKLNLVVGETFQIGQIIEDQGITEFPTIVFFRSYMKKWSTKYEGIPSAKAITKWANEQIRELDEWENSED